MRFLFSIPLPLLLISISFDLFDTKAAPYNQSSIKSSQESTSDKRFADPSYANYRQPRLIGLNKFGHAKDDVKPMALGSEGDSSQTEAVENYDELSIDELKKKKNDADNALIALKGELDKARADLERAQEEAKGPLADYEKKKKAYEELQAKADGMNKNFKIAEEEFEEARTNKRNADRLFKEWNNAKTEFEKAEKRVQYVNDASTKKPEAERELGELETDCPQVDGKDKDDLEDDLRKKNKTRNEAQLEFDEKQQKLKDCKSDCEGISVVLKNKKEARDLALKAYETAEKLVYLFNKCPDEPKLRAEVAELALIVADPEKYKAEAEEKRKVWEAKSKLKKYDNAEKNQKDANAAFEVKKAAKTAEEGKREFSPEQEEEAKEAARKAKSDWEDVMPGQKRLVEGIAGLENALQELKEKFAKDEEKVGALKRMYEEKLGGKDPNQGSATITIALAVIGTLLAGSLIGAVIYLLWRKHSLKKKEEKPADPKDSTAAAAVSQQAPKSISNSSSLKPPEAAPPPVAACSNNSDLKTPDDIKVARSGKVSDLPEISQKSKVFKEKMIKQLGPNQRIKYNKGGVLLRLEGKFNHVGGHRRFFKYSGHSSFVQDAEYFKTSKIDINTPKVTSTSAVNGVLDAFTTVTYVVEMNCMYSITEQWRKTSKERAADRDRANESLHKQKIAKNAEKRRPAGRSEKGHKNDDDELSDVEVKSTQDSRKETDVNVAEKNKKPKNRWAKRGRKEKKKEKTSEKNEPSSPSSEERSYNNTKQYHVKRDKFGSVRSVKAKPDEGEEFYNPTQEEVEENMKNYKEKTTSHDDLRKILKNLVADVKQNKRYTMPKDVELYIIKEAAKIFEKEPKMKERKGAVNIVADIHGHADNLFQVFELFDGVETEEFKKQSFIFLGDYVDRGSRSSECMQALLILKILYPDKFTLLRGNHETYAISMAYGFHDDLMERMGKKDGTMYHQFYSWMFSYMPLCCKSDNMFFTHGGIPRPEDFSKTGSLEDINTLVPTYLWDVRDNAIACALTWSDPKYGIAGFEPSSRQVGFEFGEDTVRDFCAKHKLRGMVRGHQKVQNGTEFFADDLCLTLFSCTTYEVESRSMKANNGAVMTIDEKNAAFFHFLVPLPPGLDMSYAKKLHNAHLFSTCLHAVKETNVVVDESETAGRTDAELARKKRS